MVSQMDTSGNITILPSELVSLVLEYLFDKDVCSTYIANKFFHVQSRIQFRDRQYRIQGFRRYLRDRKEPLRYAFHTGRIDWVLYFRQSMEPLVRKCLGGARGTTSDPAPSPEDRIFPIKSLTLLNYVLSECPGVADPKVLQLACYLGGSIPTVKKLEALDATVELQPRASLYASRSGNLDLLLYSLRGRVTPERRWYYYTFNMCREGPLSSIRYCKDKSGKPWSEYIECLVKFNRSDILWSLHGSDKLHGSSELQPEDLDSIVGWTLRVKTNSRRIKTARDEMIEGFGPLVNWVNVIEQIKGSLTDSVEDPSEVSRLAYLYQVLDRYKVKIELSSLVKFINRRTTRTELELYLYLSTGSWIDLVGAVIQYRPRRLDRVLDVAELNLDDLALEAVTKRFDSKAKLKQFAKLNGSYERIDWSLLLERSVGKVSKGVLAYIRKKARKTYFVQDD